MVRKRKALPQTFSRSTRENGKIKIGIENTPWIAGQPRNASPKGSAGENRTPPGKEKKIRFWEVTFPKNGDGVAVRVTGPGKPSGLDRETRQALLGRALPQKCVGKRGTSCANDSEGKKHLPTRRKRKN